MVNVIRMALGCRLAELVVRLRQNKSESLGNPAFECSREVLRSSASKAYFQALQRMKEIGKK